MDLNRVPYESVDELSTEPSEPVKKGDHLACLIGKFIRQLRRELDLSQQEFCDEYEFTKAKLSRWERGITIPNQRNRKRIEKIWREDFIA